LRLITYKSQKQLILEGFETPFEVKLDVDNHWVRLSQCMPWDELASGYYQNLSSTHGRLAKDARLVIGAVIIKHKLCLSDEETVQQIRKNFYLPYFVGFPAYQDKQPFAPSLFVEIRRRMGEETQVLFEFIAHRYESGSLIITSNQPFSQWNQIFPDSMMTVAAVDRIIHHAHIIEIEGESYRKKQQLKKPDSRKLFNKLLENLLWQCWMNQAYIN